MLFFSRGKGVDHGADKGSTDPSKREIDVPYGRTTSVFLRKYWATGREVRGGGAVHWVGLRRTTLYVQAMAETRSGTFWFFSWA